MAKSLILGLILAEAFLGLAMAGGENTQFPLDSEAAASFSNIPAASSSTSHDSQKAEAPSIRKLGKHQSAVAAFSPSEATQASEETTSSSNETNNAEYLNLQGQEIRDMKKNHHSIDKSVAGGGVILGGLATTFLVAVFCYIRATRRHKPADNQIQTAV